MTTRASSALLLAALSLFAALPSAQAMPKDIEPVLACVPSDYATVVGIPNLAGAMTELRPWADPLFTWAAPQFADTYDTALKALANTCPGPVVIAFASGKPFLLLASSGFPQAEVGRRMQALNIKVGESDGLLKMYLTPTWAPWVAVRDGLLAASADEAALRQYLAARPDKKHSVLSLPGMGKILDFRVVSSAALFICWPQSKTALDKTGFDAKSAASGHGLARRLLAAFRLDPAKPAALFCAAQEQRLSLGCLYLNEPEAKQETIPVALEIYRLPLSLCKDAAGSASGWKGPSFAAFVDDLAGGMDRFDPDVGAEFREKMGEFDRDLGFSFQNDLLGLLGPEWMCATPAAGPRSADGAAAPLNPPQLFVCSLKDREVFVARAAKFAAISQAPWERLPDVAGAQRFKTEILMHPVVLAVREDALVISSTEAVLEKALQPDGWNQPSEGPPEGFPAGTRRASELDVSVSVPALAATLAANPPNPEMAKLLNAFSKLPAAATLTLGLDRPRGSTLIVLVLSGLTAKDMNTALAVDADVLERRREHECIEKLAQIMKALMAWQADHKGAMPARLADLVPNYMPNEKSFICPSAEAAGKAMPHYGYVFIPAEAAPALGPDTIVVYDNEGNHEGGRNAGFLDGHVQWMAEAEFQAALKKTQDNLTKAKAAK